MTTETERDSAPTSLAHIVATARHDRGMTQVELAEAVRMSQEWVAKIEGGRILTPRLPALKRLAVALNIDADTLVVAAGYTSTRQGAKRIAESAPEYSADPLPAHLRASFLKTADWSPDRQRLLESFINEIDRADEADRERLRRDEE